MRCGQEEAAFFSVNRNFNSIYAGEPTKEFHQIGSAVENNALWIETPGHLNIQPAVFPSLPCDQQGEITKREWSPEFAGKQRNQPWRFAIITNPEVLFSEG